MKFKRLKREEKEIFCTECNLNITKLDGIASHRVLLKCDPLYELGTMFLKIKYISPQFEGNKYFCSNECLKVWINNNL
jgi:hypothetical protein